MNNFKQVSSHKKSLTWGQEREVPLVKCLEGQSIVGPVLCAMGNDHMGTFHPSP